MRQSTPVIETESITNLRSEAYTAGLIAGSLFIIPPAVL